LKSEEDEEKKKQGIEVQPSPKKEPVNTEEEGKECKEIMLDEEDIYIPQVEYTAICNSDMAPLICNEFVTDFLDKEHGACTLDRTDAIDLTRNFCHFLKSAGLSCAKIHLLSAF